MGKRMVGLKFESENNSPELPERTRLYSAYPNPFNPETTISFDVKENDIASLTIYNIKGQVVKSYDKLTAGSHSIRQ